MPVKNNLLEKQENIYIVFSSTSTKMGSFIQFITRYKYNHVSLSFDKNINTMYSFARYNKCIPLVGGFVEESVLRYFDENKKWAQVKICEIPISEEKYIKLKEYIKEIKTKSDEYIYNSFSAALVPIHKKIEIKNSFTCLEFINFILGEFNIEISVKSKKFFSVYDLDCLLSKHLVYEGSLDSHAVINGWGNDCFNFNQSNAASATIKTANHFKRLLVRMIFKTNSK